MFHLSTADIMEKIYPYFLRRGFHVSLCPSDSNLLNRIHISWSTSSTVGGMSISVHTAQSQKGIFAETSLVNKKGALYSMDHRIWWVYEMEDIYEHFYKFYFYAQVIQKFSSLVLRKYIHQAVQQHQKNLSLFQRSFMMLPTNDLYRVRQEWCLA